MLVSPYTPPRGSVQEHVQTNPDFPFDVVSSLKDGHKDYLDSKWCRAQSV